MSERALRWPFRLAALIAVATVPAAAAAAEPVPIDLGTTLAGYRALEPAAEGRFLESWSGSIGHLDIELAGASVFALRAGGDVLGIYVEGKGRYRYRDEDAADRQVLRANLQRLGRGDLLAEDAVTDELSRAVIFFAAPIFKDLWEPGEVEPAAVRPLAPASRDAAQRIWGRIVTTELQYDHLAAEARFNGGDRQFVFAEIEGARDTVGYLFDRVRGFTERLFAFHRLQGVEVRLIDNLSEQLVDGGPGVQLAPAVLVKAALDVSTDDNRSGTVASDLTLEAQRDGLRVLPLRLLNNRNPHSYDWASPKNVLVVDRVTSPDGGAVPSSHRYHEVLVVLPRAMERGERFDLRFETHGDFFTTGFGDTGDNYFELYTDYWYPDPFAWRPTDLEFTLRVRTRKPFRPVATGEVVALTEDGKNYVLQTRSTERVRDVAVFAGKYRTKEQKSGDRTIRVHAYAMATEKALDTLWGLTDYFLRFYEQALGPYPFDDLDVIEVPSYGFGIAPAGMVLITSEAYNPQEDYLSQYFSRGINARLAHEVAHQWFGHKAAPATARDNWISESFAEYLSGLAMLVANPDERQVAGFRRMHSDWWAEAKYCRDAGPLVAANMLGGDMASRHRYGLLYNRGPLVLHMLRTWLGDGAFFAVLKRVLDDAAMGPVSTDDFERTLREVLQTDMSWFVEDWVRHGGIPEVRVTHQVEAGDSGGLVLTGRVEETGGGGFKRMYLPLVIDYGDRQVPKFLDLDKPVIDFHVALEGQPKKITVDPAQNNLAIYR